MAITPEIQRKLYDEANARFWAQTGYKPGAKLDNASPADRAMMPVWGNIYAKVLREYGAGKIIWSHDIPVVSSLIADAKELAGQAADHIDTAVTAIATGLPPHAPEVKGELEHAHRKHVASQQATAAASQYQPPTASPAHAAVAAHKVMQFVMNNAGQGVPVASSGADTIAVMQASSAPGKAAAQVASSQEQQDATDTHEGHMHKFSAPEALAIGASIVVGLGLVAYGIENHAGPRVRRFFARRARRGKLAA